jgi:hypothetical protein
VKRIMFAALGSEVSQLGMGCASLGSRISPSQGLRALERAFDHGITWYDVAPAYGAGEAEGLIGAFAAGRRDAIRICTKVGLAPPERNATLRLVYAALRPVAGAAKTLRKMFRKSAMTRNRHLDLTPDLVRSSLERSLRRLRVDHVDVFALHDPPEEDTRRADLLGALDDLRARGLTRTLAVAGAYGACVAGLTASQGFGVAQLADPPGEGGVAARLRAAVGRPLSTVTHSVLGVGGAAETLARRIADDPALAALLRGHGFHGPASAIAADVLQRRAFALNGEGVVLMSMFSGDHLSAALAAAAAPPPPDQVLAAVEAACGRAPVRGS